MLSLARDPRHAGRRLAAILDAEDGPERVIAARRMRGCLPRSWRNWRGSGAPAITSAQYTRPELDCADAMPICEMPPFSRLARWPAERFHMSSAPFMSRAP